MTSVIWVRHGEHVANLTGMLSHRRYDGWAVHDRVLSSWRRGDLDTRVPDGENGHELVRRIRAGLLDAATAGAATGTAGAVLVVAHGANLRAALPTLTGLPDPGVDLATGGLARITVSPGSAPQFRVAQWSVERPDARHD